jgi:hypothetical protein
MKSLDLWTVVDYLPTRLPFKKESIEKALGIVLLPKGASGDVFAFFAGGPVLLQGERQIENVDLRVRNEQPHPGFLALSLSGACVSRKEVLERSKGLAISATPRGRSLDEQTYWSKQESWGKLSFGFAERNPDCLRSVVFDPKV